MGTKRIRSLVGGAVLTLLAACGGAQDGPPAPLGRHFDDVFLAQIAVDARKDEIAAKQAYDIAVLEMQKAKADYDASKNMLDLAKNERDKARIDEKSAQSNQKAANSSADLNRMKEADKDLKSAQSAKEAAEARYEYIEEYRNWLKRLMRYTEHNVYWKEAKYELAQAKLAQSNNIQPQGFHAEDYAKQEEQRRDKTADAKGKADDEKKDAQAARQKWRTIQTQTDKLLGQASDFADPMADVKGVDYQLGTDVDTQTDTSTQPVQDPTINSNPDGAKEEKKDEGGEKKEEGGGQGSGDEGGGGSSPP
jgi:hypothetical protein